MEEQILYLDSTGAEYSAEDIQNFASDEGISFDEYVSSSNLKLKDPTQKTSVETYKNRAIGIRLTDQEIQSIENNANQLITKGGDYKPYISPYGAATIGVDITRKPVKVPVYNDLIEDYGGDEEQAKNAWIELQKSNAIRKKQETLMEEMEDDIQPFFADIKKLGKYLPGSVPVPTKEETEYKVKRIALENEFLKENQEQEKLFENKVKDFKKRRVILDEQEKKLVELNEFIEKNPNAVNQNIIDDYNNLLKNYQFTANSLSNDFKDLQNIEYNVKNLNQLADVTKRSYNELDVIGSRLAGAALRTVAGVGTVINELTPAAIAEKMSGLDITNEEHLQALAPHLREALKQKKKNQDVLNSISTLGEQINSFTRERQAFDGIEDAGDFGDFILDLFSEQAVNTLVTASTGGVGLGLISIGAAGNKMQDMNIELADGKKIPWYQYYGAAIGYGGAEYITERVALNQLIGAKKALKKSFEIADDLTLDNMTFGKAIKNYGINVNKEGGAEFFATVGQNFTDRVILGNEDVSMFDGGLESYVSGALMSGLGFNSPVIAADLYKAYSIPSDMKLYNENAKKIIDLTQQYDKLALKNIDGSAVEAMQIVEQQKQDLMEQNINIKLKAENNVDQMTDNDRKLMADLHTQEIKIKNAIDKINTKSNLTDKQKANAINFNIEKLNSIENRQAEALAAVQYSQDKIKSAKAAKKWHDETGDKIKLITGKNIEEASNNLINTINESDLEADQKKILLDQVKQAKQEKGIVHGFALGAEFGLPLSVAIDNNAMRGTDGNAFAASHEIEHNTLHNAMDKENADFTALAEELKAYTKVRYPKVYNKIIEAENNYKNRGFTGNALGKEMLVAGSQFMRRTKGAAIDKTLAGKMLDWYNDIKQKFSPYDSDPNTIKTGYDVFEMLKSFNNFYETGELDGILKNVVEGDTKFKKKRGRPQKKTKAQLSAIYQQVEGYKDQLLNPATKNDTAFLIANDLLNEIDRRLKINIDKDTREDIIREFAFDDRRGLIDLLKKYNPARNESIMGYLNSTTPAGKLLDTRLIEFYEKDPRFGDIIQSLQQEGVQKKVETQTAVEQTESIVEETKAKLIKPSSLLKAPEQAINNIQSKINTIPAKSLSFKKLGDLSPETTAEIFEVSVKKVTDAKANLNKTDLNNAARNILKNVDKISRILPEGAVTEAASEGLIGTSTGVPKSLLDAFYTKDDRLTKGAGLSPYVLNKNITRENFLNALGIVDGKLQEGLSPRSPQAQRIKSIMSLTGRLITNELVREKAELPLNVVQDIAAGKNRAMFSVAVQKGIERPLIDLESGKVTNSVFKYYKENPIPSLKKMEDIPVIVDHITKYIYPTLPKEAWFGPRGGTSFNKSSKLFNISSSSALWQEFTKQVKATINLPDSTFGKPIKDKDGNPVSFENLNYDSYFKTPELIEQKLKDGSIDDFNYRVSLIHKTLWSRLNNSIRKAQEDKNKEVIPIIGLYLKAVGSDTGHWHKLGANFVGYSKKITGDRFEYEHAMPATQAYLFLLDVSLSGKNFDQAYSYVMDNYKLIALDKADEIKMNKNLKRKMPIGWRFGENLWVERYFNKQVMANGGIDPTSLLHINGNNFAQEYNVNANGTAIKSTELARLQDAARQSRPLYSVADMSTEINKMIERKVGIATEKNYSDAVAKQRGAGKGQFAFFLPPNAEDFFGLLYRFAGRGKQGDADLQYLHDKLLRPYNKGISAINTAKQSIRNQYIALGKKNKKVKRKLNKIAPGMDFTHDQVIRIYLYDKAGHNVPGLSKRDLNDVKKFMKNNADVMAFADEIELLSAQNKDLLKPNDAWLVQSIPGILDNLTNKVGRKVFLQEWIENKNAVFTKENLNKMEAAFGTRYRQALEDALWRMENGTNRNFGSNRYVNAFSNWVNNSVGAVMFFNSKSATLQSLSMFNFINWGDNNILAAGKAFANQLQFWSDFAMIFNSDKLKQRRSGLQTDVNEAEIAQAAATSKNKAHAILAYILKKGFLPTQAVDSFAIAAGGASFYRNRVNSYLKQGLDQKTAESRAFEDFSEIAESTQQSGDPALISQIQAGPLGRFIFAWQNTPFQYNRLMKKAALDLINRRGDDKTNISKILYYGAIQNFIFAALQNALFALLPGMTGDEDEDEEKEAQKNQTKFIRIANNMADSVLRGSGLPGAIVSTLKNIIMEYNEQEAKGWSADHAYTLIEAFNMSPPIGSKARKLYSGIQTKKFEKDVIEERGFAIDSPIWKVIGDVTAASTNIPLDRVILKYNNLVAAMNAQNETWQRIATALGWPSWSIGAETYPEHQGIKDTARLRRKEEGKKKAAETRKRNKEEFEKMSVIVKKQMTKEEKSKFVNLPNKRERDKYLKELIEEYKNK
ncbi:MAG: hypothetical protein O3A79_03895 [Candidatus Marinimicrobia bacterium]|nr:hypothetical protein [Candidatus Neomarinimicrobiota bacterium]